MPIRIEEVNKWSREEFQERFKNVIERWSEASVFASMFLPFSSVEDLVLVFHHYLDQLPAEKKTTVLQTLSELGEANFKSLSEESKIEQNSAGLLNFDEFDITKFNQLKAAYREKFGFPFVVCVRENTRDSIIRALTRRLENTAEEELASGSAEVKKICKIRVQDIVN